MATTEKDDDGFATPSTNGNDTDWLETEPGSETVGVIENFEPWKGSYGHIVVDGERFSLNKTQRDQLVSALVVDREVKVVTDEEESSFEGDDGEVTYHETNLKFRQGGH